MSGLDRIRQRLADPDYWYGPTPESAVDIPRADVERLLNVAEAAHTLRSLPLEFDSDFRISWDELHQALAALDTDD